MDLTSEIIWGRYALNRNLITRTQLQTCIEKLGRMKEKGLQSSIFAIMHSEGYIDEGTGQKILHLEGLIPGYKMKEVIGAGGIGIVYKAYSERLGQEVAIKILNPEYTDNSIILNRFLREIEITKKLDHPNIVKGMDSGREDDLYYLVLEYVDGSNLAVRVAEGKPLKDKSALAVAVNVTRALYYAWKKGLTHRDIKPENIILTRLGAVKVCDFGLAKLTDVNIALTVSGTIVGSPYYISPEQANGSLALDYRSDVYSLGATLYFILTGKVVFDEKTMIAVCNAHLHKTPVPISRYVSTPASLEDLILRMLSKNPEERCASPQDFVNQVSAVVKEFKKTGVSQKHLPRQQTGVLSPGTSEYDGEAVDVIQKVLKKHGEPPQVVLPTKIRSKVSEGTPQAGTSKSSQFQGKIEDAILQHLLLSLKIMDMSQLSECMSEQVDLQLQGTDKSLAEIIVDRGHVDRECIQNLRNLRDLKGKSLIPGYEVVKTTGKGGITIVYLGRSNAGETVALKVFAPGTSENSSTIARFIREAQASKRLDHPNIVKAYEVGSVYGIYYLVMEYVSGLSLAQIISKIGRLQEKKALDILEQIAGALTYAWEQNIIHRDIKPSNILSDGETVKICDLGLAKALESEIQLTQEGSILGTPHYMSPEQFQSDKELDFRTDVYSLGVTFYVMLTGSLPFTPGTTAGLAQAHIGQAPPPLEKFGCEVSKPAWALLMKMLAKEPLKRCREKGELLEDIQRVRHGKYPQNTSAPLPILKIIAVTALLAVLAAASFLLIPVLRRGQDHLDQELSLLIAAQQYRQAKDKILGSDFDIERKRHWLAVIQVEETKKAKAEIIALIGAGERQTAKNRLLQVDFSPADKKDLSDLLQQAEIRQGKSEIMSLIADKKFQQAQGRIERAELSAEESRDVLDALRRAKEEMKDQLAVLMSEREYRQARKKILEADLSAEEKKAILDALQQQEAAETKITISRVVPEDGAKVAAEQVMLSGTIECSGLDCVLVNERKSRVAKTGDNLWRFEIEVPLTAGYNRIGIATLLLSGYEEKREHILWREVPDERPPQLTLTEPDGVSPGCRKKFSRPSFLLKGYATDDGRVRGVDVNGKSVPVLAQDDKIFFETMISLKEGEQEIAISAKDHNGNEGRYVFHAYLKPQGWFGENMPDGMGRGERHGEYVWDRDQSIMVYVPEGEFYAPGRENPQKTYTPAYYIDKFETTWEQYDRFCEKAKYPPARKPSWSANQLHPVVNVSPEDAQAYARYVGKQLPTVAQWVKAARGALRIPDFESGKRPIPFKKNPEPLRIYPWGSDAPNALFSGEKVYRCNYCADDSFLGQASDGYGYTARIGDFARWPSPYGCCDMAGNVMEICRDFYTEDPHYKGTHRVKMGGGYPSLAEQCAITVLDKIVNDRGESQTGFRLVKEME